MAASTCACVMTLAALLSVRPPAGKLLAGTCTIRRGPEPGCVDLNVYLASLQELKCALQSPELGLARKDVNLLLGRADFDADGAASYAQLVDTSFGVLRERAAEAAARGALAESDEALDQFVLQCFRYFDVDGTRLDVSAENPWKMCQWVTGGNTRLLYTFVSKCIGTLSLSLQRRRRRR